MEAVAVAARVTMKRATEFFHKFVSCPLTLMEMVTKGICLRNSNHLTLAICSLSMCYLGNLLPVDVFSNTYDPHDHLQLHYPGEPVPEVLVEDEHIDFDFDLKKCRNSTCRTCIAIRYSG